MNYTKASREMVFTKLDNPDAPFTPLQIAGMQAIEEQLRKLYKEMGSKLMFIAVREKKDPVTGKTNPRIYDVYNYKNYPGMAKAAQVKLVQYFAGKLTLILNVAANLRMVIKIEPDTSKVYMNHHDRVLVFTFRMLTQEEMKPRFTHLD